LEALGVVTAVPGVVSPAPIVNQKRANENLNEDAQSRLAANKRLKVTSLMTKLIVDGLTSFAP
jgi:hypothetical protein